MSCLRFLFAALLGFAGSVALLAQAPSPMITFTLDFPGSDPSHYSIAVDATGRAVYECSVKTESDSEEQAYHLAFEVSPTNRERIFLLAKQSKFFEGNVDSGNRRLAFTGAKILSYQDGQRSFTARYNYSSLEPVRDITALFQNMAATLEYGRKLAYLHKYQKLALDDELKLMEVQARHNELNEIQGVRPVLQQIVDDPSVLNVVRARAQELIQLGSSSPAGH
jgi:hypothetical protein